MNNTPYSQYAVSFNPSDIPTLYNEWSWLVKPEELSNTLVMSSFGDLLFKGKDGKIYFLDTLEGAIALFADSEEDMTAKLADRAVQNVYLSSEATDLLKEQGLILKDNELYIYVPHPMMTGKIDLATVQIMSMKVVASLGGQLLRQIKPKAQD